MDEVEFLFSLGVLKRIKRSGWIYAGIRDPESIAEHSFRVGVIAFLLAKKEGKDPYKASTYALFHDLDEIFKGDLNRVQKLFLEIKKDSIEVFPRDLPLEIPEEYKDIIRDADKIEMLLTAIEYMEVFNVDLSEWVENAKESVVTKAGRDLVEEILKNKEKVYWWRGLL